MIQFIKNDITTDITDQFIEGKIHIICLADSNTESYASKFLKAVKLKTSEIINYCQKVNDQNEAGCFYPKYYMTLVPQNFLTDNDQETKKIVLDVLVANEKYYKSEKMVFAIEGLDAEVLKQLFQEIINEKQFESLIHLKTVCL